MRYQITNIKKRDMKYNILRICRSINFSCKMGCLYVTAFFCVVMVNACYAQKPTGQSIKIDVTKRGVTPNDAGEDSKAIQNIFTNLKPGSEVFFPAGLYLIDAPLELTQNNITLRGEEGTILKFTNKTDYYAFYGSRVGMINICGNNVTADHLYLDQNFVGSGRADGQTPLIGGILIGCKYKKINVRPRNITVTNCSVYGYYGDAISAFNVYVTNFTVTNNTLVSAYIAGNWKEAGVKGEQAINISSGENIIISSNTIKGALDDAIATHTNIKNIRITKNSITTTGGRILVCGVVNGYVADNYIEYIEDGGCAISVTFEPESNKLSINDSIIIEHNKVFINKGIKVGCGIRLHAPGKNISVTDNTFETADKQGSAVQMQDRIWLASKTKYFGDSITIKNNTFINFKNGVTKNIYKTVKDPTLFINPNIYKGVDNESLLQDGTVPLQY